MGIEHCIGELLYRYNCVVVPHFGAFLTQIKSAVIHHSTNTFYPPSKTISFNEQLTSNDGLLVSYMADLEKVSFDEMLQRILEVSKEWKSKLKNGERLILANIGEIKLNATGKMVFQPTYPINYLTSSFGLSSFVSVPVTREILKEEVLEMEEKIPFMITPEKRQESSMRPYLKYAAVFLLALATGLTGYRFYDQNLNEQQLAKQGAQEQVSKNIQEATFFNTIPVELPTLTLDVVTPAKRAVHYVIAGAYRMEANAEKKVHLLKNKGYEASYIGINKYGLHQVAYASFSDPQEALKFLRKIKRTESPDAWLLSEK